MINFDFKNPARIIFGVNSISNIDKLLDEYDVHSLMLVYSGDFVKTLGIFDTVKNACDKKGITFVENGEVVPNPQIELVRKLVQLGKENKTDFILAVGGGSSVDTAKATALGIPYDGDCWDFFTGKAEIKKAISIGAVATLPASGSETSNAAILSNGQHKTGVENDIIIPKFAIMDPTYTLGLPDFQTAAGSADILSHLLERYFTTVEHVDATDYMLEGAMKAVIINAMRLRKNPKDIDARSEVQLLASIAHNGMLELGRTSDWASHRIEHELSGQYNVTHGEGMAVVLVAYIRYMAEKLPKKFAQLANRLFNIDYNNYTEREMALLLADRLELFFKKLGLRTTLTEMKIDETHFEEMANRATNNGQSTVGHFIPLGKKEFIEVLKLAL